MNIQQSDDGSAGCCMHREDPDARTHTVMMYSYDDAPRRLQPMCAPLQARVQRSCVLQKEKRRQSPIYLGPLSLVCLKGVSACDEVRLANSRMATFI